MYINYPVHQVPCPQPKTRLYNQQKTPKTGYACSPNTNNSCKSLIGKGHPMHAQVFPPAHQAAKEFRTLRDILRWAVSSFHAHELSFGQGTDNAWDEARSEEHTSEL